MLEEHLNTEIQANNAFEVWKAIDGTDEDLLRILKTELAHAKRQGKLEFAFEIKDRLITILDMASNYDYLKSKAQSLKDFILKVTN